MHNKENLLRHEILKADRRTLSVFVALFVAICIAVAIFALYVGRLSDSRLIVNCGSFGSSDEATAFMAAHPDYQKRLNPLNKEKACTSHPY